MVFPEEKDKVSWNFKDMDKLRGCLVWVTMCMFLVPFGRAAGIPCQPPNITKHFSNDSLPSLADSYHVWVEIKLEGSNRSELVEETVDYNNNKAVLRLLSNGKETTTIFSFDNQQTFVVADATCTVQNISANLFLFVVGAQITDGVAYLPTGATSLLFGPSVDKVYAGTEVVRGMMCDRWRACVTTPQMNYTADFYFTVHDWQTASTYPQVPVRFSVQGVGALSPGSPSAFSRVYDFFGYEAENNIDPSVFETPKGVVCRGRKSGGIPSFAQNDFYHYHLEIVDVLSTTVRGAEVWYDSQYKFVRLDYHQPNGGPMSEIHDFNFGVSYIRDMFTGQCTPTNLQQGSFDVTLNAQAYIVNGSYVLTMKDPVAFMNLDSNFSYSGQRKARDLQCNVFTSVRSNFDYFNNGTFYTAIVEAYFLLDEWTDVASDSVEMFQDQIPTRIELSIPKLNIDVIYNIFNFETDQPHIEAFDVSDCFNSSARLDFRVRFPGTYHSYGENMVIQNGQNTLAQVLQVSPLRVTRVRVEYDGSYIYLLGSLLDRSPSLAQFTRMANTVIEKNDDSQYANLSSAAACSDLCVYNPEFPCNSFEYCPLDRQGCLLSKRHISDGGVSVVASHCDLYSRTVNTLNAIEPTIEEAYSNLLDKLWTSDFSILVPESDESENSEIFVAVASEIVFGHFDDQELPILPSKFSYRMEIVFPQTHYVDVYDMWYDSTSQLVRIDYRDSLPGPPYYTPYTISRIHDFTRGIAFDIDTHQGNCTVNPIQNFGTFDAQILNSSTSRAGIDMVTMKTPAQLFYWDNTYRYTGQKTVRGITCDVFESARTDFHIGGTDGSTQHSIFQYFFQAADWSYVADNHDDVTLQAPVMLTISNAEANTYMIYNFFDFNDEHLTFQNFDISPCFSDNQRIDFAIDFNQTYHPYLTTQEWNFKEEARTQISSLVRISPLRLQDLQVTYNADQTFLIGTVLGYVPPQSYFIEDGATAPYHATEQVPGSDVPGCANACYNSTTMLCNSFDLCDDKTCLLSTLHVPDGNATGHSGSCRHFSRFTNATYAEPPLEKAYEILKDVVYKGLLVLQVPVPGNETQNAFYFAKGIRNDILRSKPPSDTEEGDLGKFSVFGTDTIMFHSRLILSGMAVDDCAAACLDENFFDCDAFDYCYIFGDCYLYDVWPRENYENLDVQPSCDLYRRLYIDEYIEYPGQILESAADIKLQASSVEVCARECTLGPGYQYSCRSFDFCPTTNDCLLRHVHMVDVEPSSVVNSSTCTHYSRDYLYDFDKMFNKVLPGHDDIVYLGVPPLKCASLCLDDLACQSFEFCSGECHLSNTSANLNPNVTVSATCDLYIMQDTAREVDRDSTITLHPPTPPAASLATAKSSSPIATSATATNLIRPPGTVSFSPSTLTAVRPVITPALITSSHVHRATSVQPSPSSHINESSGCTQKNMGEPSTDTGARVGIAFGCLLLGVVIGAASVLLAFRCRSPRTGGDTMELFAGSH